MKLAHSKTVPVAAILVQPPTEQEYFLSGHPEMSLPLNLLSGWKEVNLVGMDYMGSSLDHLADIEPCADLKVYRFGAGLPTVQNCIVPNSFAAPFWETLSERKPRCVPSTASPSVSGQYHWEPGYEAFLFLTPTLDVNSEVAEIVRAANPQLCAAKEELKELSNLQDDWNGEGAKRISPASINNSLRLLENLASLRASDWPSIGPMPDGSIAMTWERGERELWIYAQDAGYKSHVWYTPDQFSGDAKKFYDPQQIGELLEWLRA